MGLFKQKQYAALATQGRTSSTVYSGEDKFVLALHIGLENGRASSPCAFYHLTGLIATAAFAYLRHGERPFLYKVTKWPGHKEETSNPEIPTIVVYHRPNFIGCGPQAPDFKHQPGYISERSFPRYLNVLGTDEEKMLPPPRAPLEQIYRDFLRYMYDATRLACQGAISNGAKLWDELHGVMEIVFLTPPSWGDAQKDFVRRAAAEAGLCDMERAGDAILFTPNPYPLLHITSEGFRRVQLSVGEIVGIVNAEHNVSDLDFYSCQETGPELVLQYQRPAAMSNSSNTLARSALQEAWSSSHSMFKDTDIDCLLTAWRDRYLETFDGETATNFGLPISERSLRSLHLNPSQMRDIFSHYVDALVEAIERFSPRPKYILATGELFLSPYLAKALTAKCGPLGVTLVPLGGNTMLVEAAVLWCAAKISTRPQDQEGLSQQQLDEQRTEGWSEAGPASTSATSYYGEQNQSGHQEAMDKKAGFSPIQEAPPHYDDVGNHVSPSQAAGGPAVSEELQRLRLELEELRAGRTPDSSTTSPSTPISPPDVKTVHRFSSMFKRSAKGSLGKSPVVTQVETT
ncbi:SubName: Full=Uncharacterized protein {ECO:0000313/EMBL:CCA69740.1} [Serendipita indica DSM 11827]|nr:SubName: Full=Uncharacterized protein {ECO:0000313/EMBL:CCA69740.1} [Serendipita indica DSM 11827]